MYAYMKRREERVYLLLILTNLSSVKKRKKFINENGIKPLE